MTKKEGLARKHISEPRPEPKTEYCPMCEAAMRETTETELAPGEDETGFYGVNITYPAWDCLDCGHREIDHMHPTRIGRRVAL